MNNFNEMKTSELVTFFNNNSDTPVKRFSDRNTAIKRCEAIQAEMETPMDGDIAQLNDELEGDLKVTGATAYVPKKKTEPVHGFTWAGLTNCPSCGIDLNNGVLEDGMDVNGSAIHLGSEFECMACGTGFGKIKVQHSKLSEAIKKSWKVEEFAKKRAQRSFVVVDEKLYPSVKQAFIDLKLPLGQHIKFRMTLKKEGKMEAYGMDWEIVPMNY